MEKSKTPIISVIMSIYNQQNKEQLHDAITSVLKQSFKDFEFIIYNDGSDETVSEYLKEYVDMDERIIIINNPKNHGLAYSLNTCIDVAKGKYLARMDADDKCTEDRLMVQYHFMENHPEFAFVGSAAYLLDDGGVWGTREMPKYPGKRDYLKFSPYIHPSVMIRRDVFEKMDAYCASKDTLRCEDYELFMRLWKAGYKGCNLQETLLYYREDKAAYKKRKFTYRIDEMKLRYRTFKDMNMLFPVGWVHVLRPLAAAMVPDFMIFGVKKLYHLRNKNDERRDRKEKEAIPESIAERSGVVSDFRRVI